MRQCFSSDRCWQKRAAGELSKLGRGLCLAYWLCQEGSGKPKTDATWSLIYQSCPVTSARVPMRSADCQKSAVTHQACSLANLYVGVHPPSPPQAHPEQAAVESAPGPVMPPPVSGTQPCGRVSTGPSPLNTHVYCLFTSFM